MAANTDMTQFASVVKPADGESREAATARATAELQAWAAGKTPVPTGTPVPMNSSSSRVSTTTKSGPYSTEQILTDEEKFRKNQEEFIAQMRDASTGYTTQAANTAQLLESTGAIQAKATLAAGETAAAKADSLAGARTLMSAATGDESSDVVRAAMMRHDGYKALDSLRAEINAADSVGVMDDPLAWMINQIKTPILKRKYNDVAREVDTMTSRINTLQADTALQANVGAGPTAQMIRDEALLQSEAQALEARAKASNALAQSKQVQAQMVMTLAGMNDNQLDMRLKIARTLTEQSTITEAQSERETQRRGSASELSDLSLINLKATAVGLPELNIEQFRQLDPKKRSYLTDNARLTANLGGSPEKAYEFLQITGAEATLQQADPTLYKFIENRLTSKAASEAKAMLNNPAMGGLKFAQQSQAEQSASIFGKLAQIEYQEVLGSKDSPRDFTRVSKDSAYSYNKIAAAVNPGLKNNWVSKYVQDKVNEKPFMLNDPNANIADKDILQEALGRYMAETKAGSTDGALRILKDVQQFYGEGYMAQWANSGAAKMGYPKPPAYTVRGIMTERSGGSLEIPSLAQLQQWAIANSRTAFLPREQQRTVFGTGSAVQGN